MKSTLLIVVAIAAGAFGATAAVSQPAQQQPVIPPELFQLSLQPLFVSPATQPSMPLFVGHRQVTIVPVPLVGESEELLPLSRPRGELIDDRR